MFYMGKIFGLAQHLRDATDTAQLQHYPTRHISDGLSHLFHEILGAIHPTELIPNH